MNQAPDLFAPEHDATSMRVTRELITMRAADDIHVVDFFVVGTPSAMGYTARECQCCHCGRGIKNVFVASDDQLYGGDCLATLSGDDSTRVAYRDASKALDRLMSRWIGRAVARPFGCGIEVATPKRTRIAVIEVKAKAADRRRVIGRALAVNNGIIWTEA